MIQTGFECAAIAATTDTHFASVVWLDNLSTDTEYTEEALTVEQYNGLPYTLQTEHKLTIASHDDPTKQAQLKTWADANTSVYIWLYGIRGSVVWGVASTIQYKRETGGKPGEHSAFTIETMYRGVSANIRNSINLLPSTARTGDYATSNYTASNCTLSSTTKNGSFTSATGNVLKLTQTVAGTYSATLGTSMYDTFPCRTNMAFYVRSLAYTSAGNDPVVKVGMAQYDSSGSFLAVVTADGIGGTGQETIAGAVTASNASTAYVRFRVLGTTSSGTTGVNEFDSMQVSYSSKVEAYYNG